MKQLINVEQSSVKSSSTKPRNMISMGHSTTKERTDFREYLPKASVRLSNLSLSYLNKHLFFNLISYFFSKQLLAQLKCEFDGCSWTLGSRQLASHRHGIISWFRQFFSELRSRITGSTLPYQSLFGQNYGRGGTNCSIFFSCTALLFQNVRQRLGIA